MFLPDELVAALFTRAAFLDKLAEVTPSLVPFVRAFYARQSVYLWWDGAGACHRILQGDGCEQGDALAPVLFALAQHAALVAAYAAYAGAHDHAVWGTLQALLGERGAAWPDARRLAFLPAREGGLGLLCATRAAPAAYWAAWADSLPVMVQRRPDAAERELLVDDEAAAPCLREAAVAGDLLRRHWPERPSWQHGWQLLASRTLNSHFRERACLRSHAGAWLAAVPTDPGTTLPPAHMHGALRRRLRLALPLTHRNKRGSASRMKVWGPRAGLSLSSGWPTLLLQASARRTGAAWLVLYGAARCSAPSRRPTAATRGRGGRRSHCGSGAPQGGALRRPGRSGWSFLLVKRAGGGAPRRAA